MVKKDKLWVFGGFWGWWEAIWELKVANGVQFVAVSVLIGGKGVELCCLDTLPGGKMRPFDGVWLESPLQPGENQAGFRVS